MNKEKWRSKEKNVTNYERDTPLGSSVYSAPLLTGARLVFVTQLNCTSMRLTNSTNCPDFLHPPAEKIPSESGSLYTTNSPGPLSNVSCSTFFLMSMTQPKCYEAVN